eukprot:gene2110-2809_t
MASKIFNTVALADRSSMASESCSAEYALSEIIAINQDPLGRQIWRKPLAHGRFAIMVLNGAAQQVRIRVSWSRDIGEAAHVWNREAAAVEDPCQDKDKNCPSWAAGGECEKNAGFMMGACLKSCPNACDSPDDLGPQATALVRDAWMESNVGMFTGGMEVTHVEAHEARVYVVEFVEPGTPMPVEDFPKPFKHTPDTAREQERGWCGYLVAWSGVERASGCVTIFFMY